MFQIVVYLTIAVHLAFIGYVVIGGFLALRWRRSLWLHVAAAVWGALIVVAHVDCPLTWLERWGRERAGMAQLPPDGFIAHYLTGVIYPADAGGAVEGAAMALVVVSWLLYWRSRRRSGDTVGGVRALIVCDVQNDFCEGGSLAVAGGAALAGAITRYLSGTGGYGCVAATQDFHIDPGAHFSDTPDYVSSWPPHCRAGSRGAEFHPDLDVGLVDEVFKKGAYSAAYSGFEGRSDSGATLGEWLRGRGVDAVDVVGIATDYCVRRTAEDAVRAGFATRVLPTLTAGVAAESTRTALAELRAAGVTVAEAA